MISLYDAAKDALQCLRRLKDADGAYRVTCIQQLEKALQMSCPKCGEPLSTNDFVFWCERGHAFELDKKSGTLNMYFGNDEFVRKRLAQHPVRRGTDDIGLEFTERE